MDSTKNQQIETMDTDSMYSSENSETLGPSPNESASSQDSSLTTSSDSFELDKSSTNQSHAKFVFRSFVQEKRKQKLYCVSFNHFLNANEPDIFAVVGGPRVSIYECLRNGKINLIQCYEDPNKKEDFWSCCWSVKYVKNNWCSVLIAGGELGIIRLILPKTGSIEETENFIGHSHGINQVSCSTAKPYLFASASRDRSFKLWNIQSSACIASFHGIEGHRDEVVSIDFDRKCERIISGGLDHCVAIWDLTAPSLAEAIEASTYYDPYKSKQAFKTLLVSYPIFWTRELHLNYVDCVRFFGDLILSKSIEEEIFCWKPASFECDATKERYPFSIIKEFHLENANYYFIRFGLDRKMERLCSGNASGIVKIWHLNAPNPARLPTQTLNHPKCKSIVRDFSFSRCGKILMFCCDDGTIWRWQTE